MSRGLLLADAQIADHRGADSREERAAQVGEPAVHGRAMHAVDRRKLVAPQPLRIRIAEQVAAARIEAADGLCKRGPEVLAVASLQDLEARGRAARRAKRGASRRREGPPWGRARGSRRSASRLPGTTRRGLRSPHIPRSWAPPWPSPRRASRGASGARRRREPSETVCVRGHRRSRRSSGSRTRRWPALSPREHAHAR